MVIVGAFHHILYLDSNAIGEIASGGNIHEHQNRIGLVIRPARTRRSRLREYIDEIGTDCEEMVLALQEHTGPSTTSCPNVHEWIEAFEGADEIFGITISSGLSASFESAEMARRQFIEAHPGAKVHIFDSKATGPVERLIIEKLREGIIAGDAYDDILTRTIEYQKSIRILYALESLNNLANNGRVNAHVARIAGVLNIRAIGHASDEGTVELLHNCRGEKRTYVA